MLQPTHHHNKAQLNEQSSTFDQIAENIDDIFWKLDLASLKFTYISPSVKKVRDVYPEDAMKLSLMESMPSDEYQKVKNKIDNLMKAAAENKKIPTDYKFELKYFNKARETIWLEVKVSIILDNNNIPMEAIGVSREITQEKNNLLELEKSLEREKFFADIIRNSSQAIGLGYNDGKGLFLNQAASELLGYTEEEAAKLNWLFELTPAKWLSEELKILEFCVLEKNPVSYKKEYIHKSGKVIPVELLVHPKFNKEGKFLYFIAFITDISEIENAKKQLKETNDRLESAIKGANDGIWDWDLKTNYQYMSPRYFEMLGYKEQEVEYHFNFFRNLVHPDDQEKVFNQANEYEFSTELRTENTFRLQHKKGHYIPILSRAYKILDEEGKLKRLVGTHTDLSEINSLRSLLEESEFKYKYLFDESNIGIGISTLGGNIIEANPYLLDLLGIHKSGMSDLNISDFYSNKETRNEFIEELHKNGNVKNFQAKIRSKSGKTIWVTISGKKINHQGDDRILTAITNIDEKIKSDQKLKESEERFKQLSKLTTEGILIHENGKVLDINDSLLKLLGYGREEILHMDFACHCLSPDNNNVIAVLNASSSIYQLKLQTKAGNTIPVEVSGRVANFKGKPAHVTSFLDISYRIETEKRLKLLTTAVEQSAHGVIITDRNGIIEYVNSAFSHITKYHSEEAIGKGIGLLESGYHPKKYFKDFWNVINSGQPWKGEFCNRDKSGKLFWVYSTITPIKNFHGEITNFLNIIEDISQKKKEQEEIEKLNTRLKLTVGAANFGFWEYKINTKETFWDDNMYAIFELPKETDKNLYEYFTSLMDKKTWHQLKNNILFGLEQKNMVEMETKLIINKKTKIIKSYVLQGHSTSENKSSIIGLSFDISQQKKFESELIEKRKKAEESDQLKSAFLANMSHEIRTPLNGIIGFTSLLDEDIEAFTKDDVKKYLSIISNNGSHLLSLVNDIIDLSKIESGQMVIINQELKLKDIIKQLENGFENIENKEVALIFDYSNLDLTLHTDATRLTQVLTNLISNALKFTNKGHVKVSQTIIGKYLQVCIEDTGSGIREEAKKVIFDRFAQGQPIKDQLLGGTGLGLSITKGLVKLLGGDIWFESEVGKGSSFYFKILINNA